MARASEDGQSCQQPENGSAPHGVLASKTQISFGPMENYRGKWPQDLHLSVYYLQLKFGSQSMREW